MITDRNWKYQLQTPSDVTHRWSKHQNMVHTRPGAWGWETRLLEMPNFPQIFHHHQHVWPDTTTDWDIIWERSVCVCKLFCNRVWHWTVTKQIFIFHLQHIVTRREFFRFSSKTFLTEFYPEYIRVWRLLWLKSEEKVINIVWCRRREFYSSLHE